jgi:hypothetical protein
MVPAGQQLGPPLPLPFTQEQLETAPASWLLQPPWLAWRWQAHLPLLSPRTRPRFPGTIPAITEPPTEAVPPATQTPAPAGETFNEPGPQPPSLHVPNQWLPSPDTVPPYIEVLDPSTEPVGVGLTCSPGAGIVRLKAVVFDPSGGGVGDRLLVAWLAAGYRRAAP